jgi:hypothetical protein
MPIRSRRQLNAIKLREQRKRERQEEEELLQAEALRLKNLKGGFARSSDVAVDRRKSPLLSPGVFRRATTAVPSKADTTFVAGSRSIPTYTDPELIARERLAMEEIEKKKRRTTVLYNKGGYQYITDGMDPKTFGKK